MIFTGRGMQTPMVNKFASAAILQWGEGGIQFVNTYVLDGMKMENV